MAGAAGRTSDAAPGVVSMVRRSHGGAGELTAALDEVLGGAWRTVLIGGDAGIGKSRLASELGARAPTAGAEVLVGACLDLAEGGAPYAAVNEVLARLGAAACRRRAALRPTSCSMRSGS